MSGFPGVSDGANKPSLMSNIASNQWIIFSSGVIQELTSRCPDSIPMQLRFDRPDWILLPGFFNSHCHLEFSDLPSPFPATNSFAEWIGVVVKHRTQSASNLDALRFQAIQSGVLKAWSTGTRFVMDTVTAPWQTEWLDQAIAAILNPLSPLARSLIGEKPIRIDPCVEVLDINQSRKEQTLAFYQRIRSQHSSTHISPHAPYTTSNQFVREAVSLANNSNAVVSMHLAESKDEMDWLANRSGSFHTRLAPFRDAAFNANQSTLLDYMQSLARADRLLIAHGNYLSSTELDSLAKNSKSASIVHCPRTYHHFLPEGREAYPLFERQEMGVQHFLGTDSCASNPDLSIWREFQCIAHQSTKNAVTIEKLLASITVAPAAFFQNTDLGSIKPGASALLNCISNQQGWPDTIEQTLLSLINTPMHPTPLELKLTELTSPSRCLTAPHMGTAF